MSGYLPSRKRSWLSMSPIATRRRAFERPATEAWVRVGLEVAQKVLRIALRFDATRRLTNPMRYTAGGAARGDARKIPLRRSEYNAGAPMATV